MAMISFNEKVEDNSQRRYKVRKSKGYRGVSLLLEPSPKQWFEDPDALVAFNIPRISARLERLMGTNVVRLTDRKYMRELRERIEEDYRVHLSNRIKTREIKELERERNLILTGKTDTIPDELAVDPIFVVNKRANIEIVKRRAKLKTNREKNAERLLRQGLKWERERLKHDEQQRLKQMQLEANRKEQIELEEQYRVEDAERGLDLLRINDQEWQPCEQGLRDFLKSERDKMKERSWRIPTQFASDPLDLRNVIRARKLFREEQRRKRLEELRLAREAAKLKPTKKAATKKAAKAKAAAAVDAAEEVADQESYVSVYLDDDEASDIPSTASDKAVAKVLPDIKVLKSKEMEAQMDYDVENGYLVTKEQYANLRYADPQITKLMNSPNIRALYTIAEKIIICEPEEEHAGGEEMEVEDEDND